MGCGNEISRWDAEAIDRSRSGKSMAPDSKIAEQMERVKTETARQALETAIQSRVPELKAILADPEDPRYKAVQGLLEKALSNGQLTEVDESRLASALNTVLNNNDSPKGLFAKLPAYRGPGSSAMQHGGELLITAAIIQKGGVPTSLGNTLSIQKHETVAFGQKLAARYALSPRSMNTVEADTLIIRDGSYVGIDTKYSKSSDTYSVTDRLERQLSGIRTCYRSGELREFYFVSNVKFSPTFKSMVERHNIEVFKDRLRDDLEMRGGFGKYLTKEEAKGYIPEEFAKYDFTRNITALREASKTYGVRQTGLCEGVKYDGSR